MRFAMTCADRYTGVFEAFIKAGWTPVKLFTVPVDNRIEHNTSVIERAKSLRIPVQISRIEESDLEHLARIGCDVLIVAGYDWRIPDWTQYLSHAVNFHPSPLPIGRGPYPIVKAILDCADNWGVTCHRIDRDFDTGAILAKEEFCMSADECHESLQIKIQFAMMRLAQNVAGNFAELWKSAAPQCSGSYWKLWSEEERTIDFTQPVDLIMRHVRAFGLIESLANIKDTVLHVRRAVGWFEPHFNRPGAVVHVTNRTLVIAAKDGYIALIEWSLVSREAFADLGRNEPLQLPFEAKALAI